MRTLAAANGNATSQVSVRRISGSCQLFAGGRAGEVEASAQLGAHELADDAWIRRAARFLRHLTDEEAEQSLLATPERRRLAGVRGDDRVDHRIELGGIRDGLLREVGRRCEAVVAGV